MSIDKFRFKSCVVMFCLYSLLLFFSACASLPVPLPLENVTAISTEDPIHNETVSWWTCRFKITWPPNTLPDSAVDLLLAHAVVKPVLEEQIAKISLWRFHRRAGPDASGHQFSFLFYTDPAVSEIVIADIQKSNVLQQTLEAAFVESVICDDPSNPHSPEVEATSDPNWSVSLQKHWPSFIMGVSTIWLGLLDDAVSDVPLNLKDASILLEQYREAEAKVTSTWYKEGQHAFLHHLSAVFGYEPLLIRKDIQF